MAVDNYLYRYSDGTTGNSPYRRDASGNIILNSSGGIADEGTFLGRSMADGSVNQSPMGNVTADGRVNTYGGYSTTADNYYSNANEAAWGRPSNVGSRPANGYGYTSVPQDTVQVNTKPLQVGGGAAFGGTSSGVDYGSTRPMQSGGGLPSASPAGSISSYTAGQNPYLQQMGDALVQQNTQNLQRNVLPRIGSAAMAAGGYGGSRQGVVESNAISDLNTANANGLASLYGGAYNTNLQYDLGRRNNDLGRRSQDQSYDLGRRNNDLGYFGAANSYNLGMGNLGLGYAGLDRQIANDNMSWGQQGYNNNMGLWGQLMNNNQVGIGAGTNIQNAPQGYWQQFGNQYNSIGQGYGTQTSNGGGGNPIMGALGGAKLGSQVANWWNGGGSGNATTATGYGNGTMSDLQGYGVF